MQNPFPLSALIAGLIVVIVGYSSSAVIIFQAAAAAGATPAQASSWLWALSLGMGITSIGLSLQHKLPLVTAWSTPGAAVLVVGLSGYSLNEAIGAFIVTALLIMLAGFTGQFERLTRQLNPAIASAMLAGVLLPFALQSFSAFSDHRLIVGSMLLTYMVLRFWIPRYTVLAVLVVGLVVTFSLGEVQTEHLAWSLGKPVWQSPAFSLSAIISLSLPLFVVTMASQNLPGIATLTAAGYPSPTSSMLKWTGTTTLLLAPFGAFALNLAAITAAICMTSDAHPDPKKRYLAAISAGVFYILLGLMAATVVAFFASVPTAYMITLAALALLPTIANSLLTALKDEQQREAALITLLVTTTNVTLFGIGGAFWGLVLGYLVLAIKKYWQPA
ncbi:MAG: benzoate/H(+) symporter BenE family transporter [Saccharospirillum sp.]|nr:benzoate/H(+) symporter BenE family transporter [Saccharospirillum sp.]